MELCVVYGGGSGGHQVCPVLRFGKSNHVANIFRSPQVHHDPVQPKGNPSMGRGSELKCVKKESELAAGFLLLNAQQFEDTLLHFRTMNSNGAATKFRTVQDQIVPL